MSHTTTPAISSSRSRRARWRERLTPAEWRSLAGMAAVIIALTVGGWFVVLALVAPHQYDIGAGATFSVGIGLTAYTLGMRHAFDADHIAAIDNTTRTLMAEGKRPLSVGFWFSLGHSSVVFVLALLLSFGLQRLVGPLRDDHSALHTYTGIIGTSISGFFLYLIAGINLVILVSIIKIFRKMRHGEVDEAELEEHLAKRGFMNRLLGRVGNSIRTPRQMYAVGLLFGLGFDTATEVSLLVIASTSALAGLPWYAILSLPVLFAAGMSLFDTLDGSFMNFAYGWAFSNPVRKIYYNLTITGLSIAVAFIIGTVEILGLIGEELDLTGWFWEAMQSADINLLGFVIVALFALTWVVAVLIWKFGHVEQKWNARLAPAEVTED